MAAKKATTPSKTAAASKPAAAAPAKKSAATPAAKKAAKSAAVAPVPVKRPTAKDMKQHAQKLPYPAKQADMKLQPGMAFSTYRPAGKLQDKIALITGADSGIGRAVAVAFAMEGAHVAVLFNENVVDAEETKRLIEAQQRKCILLQLDVRDPEQCRQAVRRTRAELGGLNILVNNAAFQMSQEKFEDIPEEQIRRTFDTNILGYIWMAQAAVPHLKKDDCIINTGSIVGLTGIPILIDYACTKSAIHALTKSLATHLGERGIRVNCVVPGPVWTPNIPGTMPREEIEKFGYEVALARPGQPEELAPAYVLLASQDGSFMTGSLVHVTGGKMSSDQ
ncbi:SDR family oxidoreductase [Microvirga sp. STR05]|uniref:SDR family oxidoreductase n=2 Tax=Hymenobacter TaxID=89966 RepID=A0A7G7W7Y1_9BACT|nr:MULTISPECIES: SDR family oxidoreductase [Hymenobacter]MBD2713977.1 SDR family oxidoreductase [Hymenobacter duratus]MBR7948879.1 SDR family oxidoreductase [Microvirga sp. STR05]QNH62474.1 SDR family oxidoreductase [Hymenobacter sediminicola]